MKNIATIIILLNMLFTSACNKYTTRVAGEVIDAKTRAPIKGAKVVVSNRPPVYTDENGEFYIDDYDLGKYIVDSITFNVRANDNYQSRIVTDIIGNKQQEIYTIEMYPKTQLSYIPSGRLALGLTVTTGTIKINNGGLDTVGCILSSPCGWLSYGSNNIAIPPTGAILNIQTIISGLNCRDSCFLYFEWGEAQRDSILVVKEIPDTEKPFATFKVSDNTPNQYSIVDFDASGSKDNCSAQLKYSWKFESTATWTLPTPSPFAQHTYYVTGTQKAELKVIDEQGNEAITSQDLVVQEVPTVPSLNPNINATNANEILCVNLEAILVHPGQTFTGLTDHGFVWSSTTQFPEVGGMGDSSLGAFNGISGGFNKKICNLKPVTYYFRAYAKNPVGVTYSNPKEVNVELLQFITIQPQNANQISFTMGDNTAPQTDAKPSHTVILSPFKISKTEVTNQQYATFLNTGLPFATINSYIDLANCDIEIVLGLFKPKIGKEHFPVTSISWQGAYDFCVWTGGRLPTEAEWECAAKSAGASPPYPLYSGSNILDSYGWYTNNASGTVHPTATREPNDLGLFDMSGNVREWCADWYSASSYTAALVTNPVGPSQGPGVNEKVLRGGSFALPELPARTYSRDKRNPGLKLSDIGFRCVKN